MSCCVAFLFYLCADEKVYKYAACKVEANKKLNGTVEGKITGDICAIVEIGKSVVVTTVHWHLSGFPKNTDQQYCAKKINSTNSCDTIEKYDKNSPCRPNPLATPDNGKLETNFQVPTQDVNLIIGQSVVIFKRESINKPLGEKVACCVYEYVKECK